MNSAPLAPAWLVDRLKEPARRPANTNAAPTSFMAEGSRNSNLASMAGFLRRKHGLDEEQLFEEINAINYASPVPLPEAEVRSIARSIANYSVGEALEMQDLPLSRRMAATIAPN